MFETKLSVDLTELKRLSDRFPEAAKKAKEAGITEALMLLEREVKMRTAYGAGPIHLRDTIHGKVRAEGERTFGILGTPMQHGEPVERGTKAHFPPVGPLAFWVEKKLGYTGKEARSVAFLIARAISRRGTKGIHMFETALKQNEARVVRILKGIPEDIIRRATGE